MSYYLYAESAGLKVYVSAQATSEKLWCTPEFTGRRVFARRPTARSWLKAIRKQKHIHEKFKMGIST